MILGNLGVRFMNRKQITMGLIILGLLLIVCLFTLEDRQNWIEDLNQNPSKHAVLFVIG